MWRTVRPATECSRVPAISISCTGTPSCSSVCTHAKLSRSHTCKICRAAVDWDRPVWRTSRLASRHLSSSADEFCFLAPCTLLSSTAAVKVTTHRPVDDDDHATRCHIECDATSRGARLHGAPKLASTHLDAAVLGGAEQAPILVHPHRQDGAAVPGQAVLLRMDRPQCLSRARRQLCEPRRGCWVHKQEAAIQRWDGCDQEPGHYCKG